MDTFTRESRCASHTRLEKVDPDVPRSHAGGAATMLLGQGHTLACGQPNANAKTSESQRPSASLRAAPALWRGGLSAQLLTGICDPADSVMSSPITSLLVRQRKRRIQDDLVFLWRGRPLHLYVC